MSITIGDVAQKVGVLTATVPTVLFLFCVSISISKAEVLYINDFGTELQRKTGDGGDWDRDIVLKGQGSSALILNDDAVAHCNEDLDGDGKTGTVGYNKETMRFLVKKIKVPQNTSVIKAFKLTLRGFSREGTGRIYAAIDLDGKGSPVDAAGKNNKWEYVVSGDNERDMWDFGNPEITVDEQKYLKGIRFSGRPRPDRRRVAQRIGREGVRTTL